MMPVKMDWDNTKMVSAMGMDWDETATDIALLDLPTLEFTTESDPCFSTYGVHLYETPMSPLHQIISHDCMWSGTCGDKSHPGKTHPLNTPCSTATSISSSSSSNNLTNNNSNNNSNSNVNSCKVTSNISNKVQVTSQQQEGVKNVKQEQMKIPAGRSLLRNFNNNNNNNTINSPSKQLIRSGVHDKGGTATRPDTPLSLDDDSPEFKHHIDLAGTIAGTMNNQFSNGRKISICANNQDDSSHIITLLKEHLEDDDVQGHKSGQILEILSNTFLNDANGQTDNVLDYLKYLSDYEEDDSAVDMDSDSDEYTSSSSGYGCSSNSLIKTEKYSNCISSSASSNNNAQLSHVPVPYDYQETHFGDHSYTRPKDRFDTRDLGVQTPSDSEEEEIDVVSVGDRTLPTNPSARDRRHLQTAVAHKISARMVKTQKNGLRTIPPRRRMSNDDNSPNSSMSNTPVKHFIHNGNPNYTGMPTIPAGLSKKRPSSNGISNGSSKKHRSNNHGSSNNSNKKQKTPNKRNFSDSDELETLEKRNLHNDMERQRRIGLKNLFEELKSTIPSIKDKERAPKVNILREAAALCNKLTREHDQYQALKKQQTKLLTKVKQLRAALNKRIIPQEPEKMMMMSF